MPITSAATERSGEREWTSHSSPTNTSGPTDSTTRPWYSETAPSRLMSSAPRTACRYWFMGTGSSRREQRLAQVGELHLQAPVETPRGRLDEAAAELDALVGHELHLPGFEALEHGAEMLADRRVIGRAHAQREAAALARAAHDLAHRRDHAFAARQGLSEELAHRLVHDLGAQLGELADAFVQAAAHAAHQRRKRLQLRRVLRGRLGKAGFVALLPAALARLGAQRLELGLEALLVLLVGNRGRLRLRGCARLDHRLGARWGRGALPHVAQQQRLPHARRADD